MRRVVLAAVVIASTFAAQGCLQQVPGTGRQQLLLTSPEQENQLGLQAYQEVLQKEKKANDPEGQALVERVGKRLAAVVPKNDFQWEFNLFENPEMNAFCLPGGKVAVYTGILPVCRDEAALACVLGHEIGHAIARHGGERMTESSLVQGAGEALQAFLQGKQYSPAMTGVAMGAFGLGSKVGLELPFSRKQESEADTLGLQYMAMAGYDPQEAVTFWQRFASVAKSGTPSLLSDHPASDVRAKDLMAQLPKAKELYAKAAQHSGAGATVPAKYLK